MEITDKDLKRAIREEIAQFIEENKEEIVRRARKKLSVKFPVVKK